MNDEKYPFVDVSEDDVSPLFTTKLQEEARVGCLRGVFVCDEHPQAQMSGRQTFYAFRINTGRYQYYLRLFPQQKKFYLFCYQTDQFRKGRPEPDFNYTYRKSPRRKSKLRGER